MTLAELEDMHPSCREAHDHKRIVLTGGPGAGKTAVLELVRTSLCGHVRVLPESAGILFGGGFPRGPAPDLRRAVQRAIFYVQRELEGTASGHDVSIVLCDRGTVVELCEAMRVHELVADPERIRGGECAGFEHPAVAGDSERKRAGSAAEVDVATPLRVVPTRSPRWRGTPRALDQDMTSPLRDVHDPRTTAAIVGVPREVWPASDVSSSCERWRSGSAGSTDGVVPADARFAEYIWADTTT